VRSGCLTPFPSTVPPSISGRRSFSIPTSLSSAMAAPACNFGQHFRAIFRPAATQDASDKWAFPKVFTNRISRPRSHHPQAGRRGAVPGPASNCSNRGAPLDPRADLLEKAAGGPGSSPCGAYSSRRMSRSGSARSVREHMSGGGPPSYERLSFQHFHCDDPGSLGLPCRAIVPRERSTVSFWRPVE
jgi:hypothetical protein